MIPDTALNIGLYFDEIPTQKKLETTLENYRICTHHNPNTHGFHVGICGVKVNITPELMQDIKCIHGIEPEKILASIILDEYTHRMIELTMETTPTHENTVKTVDFSHLQQKLSRKEINATT